MLWTFFSPTIRRKNAWMHYHIAVVIPSLFSWGRWLDDEVEVVVVIGVVSYVFCQPRINYTSEPAVLGYAASVSRWRSSIDHGPLKKANRTNDPWWKSSWARINLDKLFSWATQIPYLWVGRILPSFCFHHFKGWCLLIKHAMIKHLCTSSSSRIIVFILRRWNVNDSESVWIEHVVLVTLLQRLFCRRVYLSIKSHSEY